MQRDAIPYDPFFLPTFLALLHLILVNILANLSAKCYVIIHLSTGSHFTCLEPWLDSSQHKTNGALVHNNSSMIQLQLYDVITSLADNQLMDYK